MFAPPQYDDGRARNGGCEPGVGMIDNRPFGALAGAVSLPLGRRLDPVVALGLEAIPDD